MSSPRVHTLINRLEKGTQKTNEIFSKLTQEQWKAVIFDDPEKWTWRDLLAHFVSAEGRLFELAQNVAVGGEGAPEGFDFDAFNAAERTRLLNYPPAHLLTMLDKARQETLAWVATLNDTQLDYVGRHPALGIVSVETMVTAIYGHQLLHMREIQSKQQASAR